MENIFRNKTKILFVSLLFFGVLFLGNLTMTKASSSVGSIDSIYKYAKGVGNGNVKINFGIFEGSLTVVITDKNITGFAWGENIGWLNLSPSGGGVLNNNEGALSGYATSEYGGLVDFKGVTINSSGEFMGYANSEKLGQISFNCANNNSCMVDDFKVKTDWRPASVRNNTKTPSSANIPLPAEKPIQIDLKPDQKKDTEDQNTNVVKPKPLPITDLSQYEGGGDVVRYNENTSKINGGINIIKEQDSGVSSTSEIDIKNDKIPEIFNQTKEVPNVKDSSSENNQSISLVVKEIKKEAMDISNSTVGEISTKTVSTVGVAGGGTALFSSVLGGTLSFSEILINFFRIWGIFMSAIGLRKKRQPWGTVYDSVTKQPLDPAYVVLQDKDNKEIATSITDIDGRYGFLVPPGVYKIYARKNNYSFPSKKLFGKDADELYENLYFGEYLNFEDNKLIIKNIPMDPERFDWNQFMKKNQQKLMKFNSPHKNLLTKISDFLFYFGFIITLLLLLINGVSYYNLIMLVFYIIFFIFRKIGIKVRSYGSIIEYNTGYPLAFSIIRIFKKDSTDEIFHRVADRYGHYYCLLPNGEYYVSIEKKNADESYEKVFTSEVFSIKNGILNRNFEIKNLF
jgi:hypothetical protein